MFSITPASSAWASIAFLAWIISWSVDSNNASDSTRAENPWTLQELLFYGHGHVKYLNFTAAATWHGKFTCTHAHAYTYTHNRSDPFYFLSETLEMAFDMLASSQLQNYKENNHCMIFKFNVPFYRLVKHTMIISHYLWLQIRWQDRLEHKVNYNSEVWNKRKGSGYNGRRSIGRRNRRNEKTAKGRLWQSGYFAGSQRYAARLHTVQILVKWETFPVNMRVVPLVMAVPAVYMTRIFMTLFIVTRYGTIFWAE
jgi:hypothetical protein